MYKYPDLELRKFAESDITYKVGWVNDPANNQYLHYSLPYTQEMAAAWYERTKDKTDQFNATLLYRGQPVGTFGLLGINPKNSSAEYYALLGKVCEKGKGLGTRAGILMLCYAFYELGLHRIWVTIEVGNEPSLRCWKNMGGRVEGYINEYYRKGERYADAYYGSILRQDFLLPEGLIPCEGGER